MYENRIKVDELILGVSVTADAKKRRVGKLVSVPPYYLSLAIDWPMGAF